MDGGVVGARIRDALLVGYARAMDHPAKLRLLRLFAKRFNVRPVLRLPDGGLLCVGIDDFIGWAMIKAGSYEPRTLALARRLLTEFPGPFIDVGANVGLFSVAMARIAGASVVAIEPDCENCAHLRGNISLNGYTNVKIFNGAVSSETGIASFSFRRDHNSGSAYTSKSPPLAQHRDWVPLLTLDQILTSVQCDDARPALIKIDIEGAEKEALLGLSFEGPHRPRNIIFEYTNLSKSSWGSLEGARAFFEARGYALLSIDGIAVSEGDVLPEDNIWAREQ